MLVVQQAKKEWKIFYVRCLSTFSGIMSSSRVFVNVNLVPENSELFGLGNRISPLVILKPSIMRLFFDKEVIQFRAMVIGQKNFIPMDPLMNWVS